MSKILISGSLAYDRIMDFAGRFKDNILPDKIHILNVSFLVNDLKENFGGTAGNIAYNLALLGEQPAVLASAGNDFLPYKRWLTENKIDVSKIKIVKNKKTASAYIITDRDDNQITGFYPGAMGKKFKVQSSKFKVDIAIIAPGNLSDMINFCQVYQKNGTPYIFDPGQQITSFSGDQLRKCIKGAKVLIGNDYEINLISKKTGWNLEKLKEQVEILVITLGAKGAMIYKNQPPSPSALSRQGRGNNILAIKIPPAKPKNTTDPTGAGDAFRAGLIYGLARGWPIVKTGRLAALVAVYTVEKYGTQTHLFTWSELKNRYLKNFGEGL